MREVILQPFSDFHVAIKDHFWTPRLLLNSQTSILHQWQQLEASGCIQNFRILADQAPGFRLGWFFADSDAYKWLDAASRCMSSYENLDVLIHVNELVNLISRAQATDGYLFTYNQIHFPDSRWQNLQIEHELYCHGHLIEAAIAHHQATGQDTLLNSAIKAADLICDTFLGKAATNTPGHEEIEIALIRLYDLTSKSRYLDMAEQFLENRGSQSRMAFAWRMLQENRSMTRRAQVCDLQQREYEEKHPEAANGHHLPPNNRINPPRWANERFLWGALTGTYFQQHAPIRRQHQAVGHAVRYAYLQTATTMLAARCGDYSLWHALRTSWNHMVEKRMFVTGGTGSLPISEGFGRDYELDPAYAYSETCAALGTMYWNWEMSRLFKCAAYDDLFEHQLYNASLVGIGQDGKSYLYNNPLENRDGFQRAEWFEIPCCPSNLSRTWASLDKYICSNDEKTLTIHQYIASHISVKLENQVCLQIKSQFPWQGRVALYIEPRQPVSFTLKFRIPSWCAKLSAWLNGETLPLAAPAIQIYKPTASGYDPRLAEYACIEREWQPGDILELEFEMPIRLYMPHRKVKSCKGRVAVARGPLIYCLEAEDNPGVDLFSCMLDVNSLVAEEDPVLLDGIIKISGKSITDEPLTFIPYAWWANRSPGPMTVYVCTPE